MIEASGQPFKLTWQNALVALPVAHLILASAYLYGYCFGFGSTIATFVSPGDIFITSIRNIAPMYALMGIVGVFTGRREIGRWLTSEPPVPEHYGPPPMPPKMGGPVLATIRLIILALAISVIAGSYLTGQPIDMLLLFGVSASLLIVGDWMFKLKNNHTTNVVMMSAFAIFGSTLFGMNGGQQDRFRSFETQARRNAACGDYVILRKFSDLYLAIGKNSRHRMIDGKDCSVKFAFPDVEPMVKPSDLPPSIRWLFESYAVSDPNPVSKPLPNPQPPRTSVQRPENPVTGSITAK